MPTGTLFVLRKRRAGTPCRQRGRLVDVSGWCWETVTSVGGLARRPGAAEGGRVAAAVGLGVLLSLPPPSLLPPHSPCLLFVHLAAAPRAHRRRNSCAHLTLYHATACCRLFVRCADTAWGVAPARPRGTRRLGCCRCCCCACVCRLPRLVWTRPRTPAGGARRSWAACRPGTRASVRVAAARGCAGARSDRGSGAFEAGRAERRITGERPAATQATSDRGAMLPGAPPRGRRPRTHHHPQLYGCGCLPARADVWRVGAAPAIMAASGQQSRYAKRVLGGGNHRHRRRRAGGGGSGTQDMAIHSGCHQGPTPAAARHTTAAGHPPCHQPFTYASIPLPESGVGRNLVTANVGRGHAAMSAGSECAGRGTEKQTHYGTTLPPRATGYHTRHQPTPIADQ